MARGWHGGASYDWGGVVAGQQATLLTLTMDAGDTPSEFVAGLYTMESTTPVATLAVTVTSGLVVIDPTAAVATLDRGQYRWAGIADDVVWLSGTFEVLLVNSARGGSSSLRTLAVNVGTANTINVTLGTSILPGQIDGGAPDDQPAWAFDGGTP